jgi:hypothetical protein
LGRARGGALRLLVMGDTRAQAIRISAGPAQSSAGVWEATVDESVGLPPISVLDGDYVWTPSSIGTLRAMFDEAIRTGARFNNPASGLSRMKIRQKRLELPSREECGVSKIEARLSYVDDKTLLYLAEVLRVQVQELFPTRPPGNRIYDFIEKLETTRFLSIDLFYIFRLRTVQIEKSR